MDEAAIVAVLETLTLPDGSPLVVRDEVAGVMSEPGWLCVMLRTEGANNTELLAQLHAHLAQAFPDTEVEVRVDRRIYRGGEGFGDGRHVVVVLGDPTGPISHEFARIGARVRAWLQERGGFRCETDP